MLGGFGEVDAVELDAAARAVASNRLGKPVVDARLPALTGIARSRYQLVAALDVIEHVEDDAAALTALAACLAPGGKLLITVPAFPSMWSGHDVANHHFRRYTKRALRDAAKRAGLQIEFIGWFNALLFPLAVVNRLAARITGKQGSDDAMPPAPVNWLFETLFALEQHLIARLPLPPGLSIAAILVPAVARQH
jgi:SAM-dependent methyltransferase